jgi:Flp pilus assembly protein TadB
MMIFGQHVSGSLRLMIIVTFAVALAVASFANSFAMMLGIAAVTLAGGFAIIILMGAFVSLRHDRTTDETLPASIRLSNEDNR